MSLKTQILCGFRLFLLKKTVLEFGNEQHFAGCGYILRLFADSLHRTQSANAAKDRVSGFYAHSAPVYSAAQKLFFRLLC